ncbi:MAG: cytochrome c maturation protein CcmE, partial [Actinomycetota bacterium]|nr:cytochrome c maturation protein CcmE [Actinomycetota bacterium]
MVDDLGPRSAPLDLTPEPARPVVRTRRPGAMLLLLGVVAAVVFVLLRSLGDASLFFYEVSEAVELRSELGDDRFRVVGTPQPGLVEGELGGEAAVVFTLCADDVLADVVHLGDPAELFQPGVPVVLQGAWKAGRPPDL